MAQRRLQSRWFKLFDSNTRQTALYGPRSSVIRN